MFETYKETENDHSLGILLEASIPRLGDLSTRHEIEPRAAR
jgi:hypothetical protein